MCKLKNLLVISKMINRFLGLPVGEELRQATPVNLRLWGVSHPAYSLSPSYLLCGS